MRIILDIATIVGGIGTVLFVWDRFIASRLRKENLKNTSGIERREPGHIPQTTTLIREPMQVRDKHSPNELFRPRPILDDQKNKKPLWLIFAIPAYCGISACIICLITVYLSDLAGGGALTIMLIPAFIGLHLQSDFTHEDTGFLLSWGSYIIFITGMAGIGTISDNKLDLSDPTIRTIYFAAEICGGIILGMLAAIIRSAKRKTRK